MEKLAFPLKLADRMELLPDYMFAKINALRHEKRQQGMDLVDLAMGNPKDPTPQPIVDKLNEVAHDPRNQRYSVASGIYNLRNELKKYYQSQFGVTLDPDQEVICTIGSKEGFSHLSLALLGPGDFAVVPAPSYPIHTYSVLLTGAQTLRIPIEDEEVFLKQLADLAQNHKPKPKVVFLNFPHNPTGKCVELKFFDEVVRLAKKYEFIVVHDFAYSRITFDGVEAPSFLQAEGAKEVGCEFGTMSKAYNMAGWRVGYALGNAQIISALNRIKSYYDYGNFQAIQIASIIAIRECQDFVTQQVDLYQKRKDLVVAGLEGAGWEVGPVQGGMFIWVKIPEPFAAQGSFAFAEQLIEKAQVVVSPGIGFGEEGEGYIRLALVENEKRIRQALRNIRQAFSVEGPIRQAL